MLISLVPFLQDGKFELSPSVAAGGPLMDEVVVSGLAMVEYQRRQGGGIDAGTAVDVSMSLIGAGGN